MSYEFKGRHDPGIERSECQRCENLKKHREYLKSQRKYEIGEPITDFQELMQQTWIFCGFSDRPMHIEAIKSWQARIVLDVLERGKFYKAVRKERGE